MRNYVLLVGLLILILASVYVSASLTDGLVAYYNMDSATGGESNQVTNNTGLDLVDAGSCNRTDGKIGFGRGNFSLLNYLTDTSWETNLSQTSNSSICYWITYFSFVDYEIPLSTGHSPSDAGYFQELFYSDSSGNLKMQVTHNGASGIDTPGANLSSGLWYHVCGVYDGSNGNTTLYVDGVEIGSATLSTTIGSTPDMLRIGIRSDGLYPSSDAWIDEVGFWGRKLNSSEIGELYNVGSGLAYPFTLPPETCLVCNQTCSPCGGGCNTTDMSFVYQDVTDFDATYGDITGWNTSCITNMQYMFKNSDFNQDISGWDTSSVQNMAEMFSGDHVFNQNLSAWDMTNVWSIREMFYQATLFNGDVSGWNFGNLHQMTDAFGESAFNGDVSGWNTTGITNMNGVFAFTPFNQDISMWDTSLVTSMTWMFQSATSFEQNLSTLDVSSVGDATDMFSGVTLSTANYDSLLCGWAGQSIQTGVTFGGGNSQYTEVGQPCRDFLTSNSSWTITDGGLYAPCVPAWNCTAFTSCVADQKNCTEVTDTNLCGELFSGNLSDYDEACVTPPIITGYVASFGVGDLPKLIIDNMGQILVMLISLVGLVVLGVVVVYGVKGVKKIIKR